jgi:DNA mismatch repair protein MutS
VSGEPTTPLMRQYHAVKQQAPNALLLFRLGDFFELFYEDAIVAARDLDITLTSRNKEKGEPVPMCGVPAHSIEGYLARLIQKGHRVAICEQMEDPKATKHLVKREITRIVTPGTVTEASLLRSHENNYLAALAIRGEQTGLAHVDLSTGEFRTTEMERSAARAALEQLNVREVLLPDSARDTGAWEGRWVRTPVESWAFSFDYAERSLRDHFKLASLDGCGLAGKPLAVSAAAALLHYLRETQRSALNHLDHPAYHDSADSMVLDAVTVRNLELTEPLFTADLGGGHESALISVIDKTETGMGGRLLRRRMLRPSLDQAEVETRLEAVEAMARATMARAKVREVLSGVGDLERLLARITVGTASPRDVLGLGRTLDRVPRVRELLVDVTASRLAQLRAALDDVPEVRERVLRGIADAPPPTLAAGGVIRSEYHAGLDELRNLSKNSRQIIASIESRERERTGIQSLKVRFNNVFGFYIEISNANLHLVPASYDRKQTLVNAERFTTPELKELEAKVLDAEEKILGLERELFQEICSFAAGHAARIRATAAAIAEIDVYCALAQTAMENRYVRPAFSNEGELQVTAGRHPVIEQMVAKEALRFIPNDVFLDRQSARIAVITGPNMGGKSTYLRQIALTVILAQMGSFVPADSAVLPLVDRVFTRIGASDNLARGRSTFMVEMTETAVILNTATARSLIVLDEIGRGTATYDGLALAWSVIEHIHGKIGAATLFATHYHELTELAERLDGVRNLHVSVKESGDQVIFLRKVEPGSADKSYGIEVARLAALPLAVIERAREILALHEESEHTVSQELAPQPAGRSEPLQIRLFEPLSHPIADRIRNANIDELRPIDALKLLQELQEELNR